MGYRWAEGEKIPHCVGRRAGVVRHHHDRLTHARCDDGQELQDLRAGRQVQGAGGLVRHEQGTARPC